ncbi:MAG: GAF domain-containing protein [Myxococcales bacterium]|nr:GAF domain-containing protein [Myxococcales bacterium]
MQFERGLLDLSHVTVEGSNIDDALARVARLAARSLSVNRVSIWVLGDDGALWRCLCAIDAGSSDVSSGWELEASKYPSYARALRERRTVALASTRADPASRELVHDYFEPLDIGASLDAPIYRAGKIFGIVCCELVSGERQWTEGERAFATSVADVIGALFEQAARIEAERKLALSERSRRESDKMEALGRMAAAVAHDFNNILGVQQLLLDSLARPGQDEAARRESIHLLREASESGRRLTRRLLSLARADGFTAIAVSLSAVVQRAQATLEGLVAPSKLEVVAASSEDTVLADPIALEQVLLNLASNARDAIASAARPGLVEITISRRGEAVVLSFQDNGEGMDESVRERLFEPYFSTRSSETNAGLGMATIFRIVEAHRATIDVRSKPGAGTTIELRFPAYSRGAGSTER